MINNQQTNTNVQFGNLQLSTCVYQCDNTTNPQNGNCTVTLTFKYLGSQQVNGIKTTLFDKASNILANNDTYVKESLVPSTTQQLKYVVPGSDLVDTNGKTGNLNKAPLTVEFSGKSVNIPPLKIESCRKVVELFSFILFLKDQKLPKYFQTRFI